MPVVAIRPGGALPAGIYRYEASAHRLVPTAVEEPLVDDGDAPCSILLVGDATSGRATGAGAGDLATALAHRLALAAAELDLAPRPVGADEPTGEARVSGGRVLARLDLGGRRAAPPGVASSAGSSEGAGSRLEAILAVASPRCREPLFSPDAWSAVQRLARAAPLPARDVGLECRLGSDDPRVDLAAAFETRLWGAPRSEELVASPARTGTTGAAGWAALDRFRSAHEESAALRRCTRHLGIELDADSPGDSVPAPGLFVGLLDGTIGPIGPIRTGVRDAVRAGLPALLGAGGSPSSIAAYERFLDHLPAGSVLHYFGAFSGRAPGVARFNVQYPDRDAALAHLTRQGAAAHRLASVEEVYGWEARVVLAWDVGPASGDRLGIELLFDRPSGVAPVLDRLVERGVCTPAKRDAVLAWPHALQEVEAETPWPQPLRASERRSPGVRSVLFAKLSHLKLVVRSTGESAKAYLQLQHAWVPPPLRTSASRQSAVVNAAEPK